METRRTLAVRVVSHREGRLGRDQDLVPPSLDHLTENLFREALGIDLCRIEEIDAGIEAEIDHAGSRRDIGLTEMTKELAAAAETGGAEAEDRNLQAGTPELAMLHETTSLSVGTSCWAG